MSFLYPRIITIRRLTKPSNFGALAYSGSTPDQESDIAKNIRASIQRQKTKGTPDGHVPSDAYSRSEWTIFVPSQDRKLIQERDVIVDDTAKRYLVSASYWNSLGYNLSAELLEA